MSTIVTRAGKGSALTHTEVDANFTNLNTDKVEAAQSVTLTNKTIALGSNTVSGTTAQFNTALTDGDFATLAGSETLTNKTISGSSNTLSNIGNSSLTNSSVTIGSTSVSLGSTATTVSGLTLSSPTVNTPTLSGGTINNASVGATTPSTGAFTTLSATGVTTVQAGTAAAPAITTSGDTNTGVFFPAADTVAIGTGGTEALRVNSSQNVGIGTTSPGATFKLDVAGNSRSAGVVDSIYTGTTSGSQLGTFRMYGTGSGVTGEAQIRAVLDTGSITAANLQFYTGTSERARITSAGAFVVAKTSAVLSIAGSYLQEDGFIGATRDGNACIGVNRLSNDGTLIFFQQAGTEEGSISVSGTTVSYNGGHLSRYAQTQAAKDESILKGTVLSNLDDMNVYVRPTTYWTEEDELPEGVAVGDVKEESAVVANEQLNKVKVSDVEGDVNVAGVFVNWTYDEQHQVDEINMAMTGDMIIRIAQGVSVQKGDLLMSAGDGTAKPQGDDIVRSKTIAKVTSNHVTCTYDDGSYCVPCVLMAC